MQNTFSQSGNDSKWFLTKIIFQNRYVALETPSRPPPSLHGKCHLKFPFWFFDSVPSLDIWKRNIFLKLKLIFQFQCFRYWKQFEETSKANNKIVKALLKVVRRHLTPPPSSTNVEKLFSYGGLVATDHRSSISGEKLDQILFLRENALMANFDLGWL